MSLTVRRPALAALAALVFGGAIILPACSGTTATTAQVVTEPGRGLTAFQSDEELRDFLRRAGARAVHDYNNGPSESMTASPAPTMQAAPAADAAAAPESESITNNQEAGVDEGGIVKNWRDYLVVLRRGRLFTVSLANNSMRPVDTIDAFPPGVSGQGDWYDEMLIAGDRVIVIGYSYARGGTEVNRFRIAPDGQLSFEDAYHLKSNDYYSSRNYASRLIGNRLVYYTPLYLGWRGDDPLEALPGVRKWGPDADRGAFRRIADARRVFIAPSIKGREDAPVETMHSVIDCNLTAAELDCQATAVLGPSSRNFYVSSNAVYLSVSDYYGQRDGRPAPSYVYRLPFSRDDTPAAIGTRGVPIDQFSFREDPGAGRLDILVRHEGRGDATWGPETGEGTNMALLQLPLTAFGDGSMEAEAGMYRRVPALGANAYNLQNRFVGGYLLYGAGGSGYGAGEREGGIVAVPVAGGEAVRLPLPHGVERIEAMGRDALAIGNMGEGLGFTAIHLGERPMTGERYVQRVAAQGESRSHGYFFRPDRSAPDGASGTIGLPVMRSVEPTHRRYFGSAAAMLFLRRDNRNFTPAGELDARPADVTDDACQASCIDWYGNARPIFLGDRVFALLGYELVEGSLRNGRIGEIGRVNFAPRGTGRKPD